MSNEQSPGSLVSTQFVDVGPYATRPEDRVPGHAVTTDFRVDGTDHACSGVGERCSHTVDEVSGDSGLITEKHRGGCGTRTHRAQPSAQRGALALGVLGVQHHPNTLWAVDRCADLFCAVTEHEDDLVEAGCSSRVYDVLQQWAVVQWQ